MNSERDPARGPASACLRERRDTPCSSALQDGSKGWKINQHYAQRDVTGSEAGLREGPCPRASLGLSQGTARLAVLLCITRRFQGLEDLLFADVEPFAFMLLKDGFLVMLGGCAV